MITAATIPVPRKPTLAQHRYGVEDPLTDDRGCDHAAWCADAVVGHDVGEPLTDRPHLPQPFHDRCSGARASGTSGSPATRPPRRPGGRFAAQRRTPAASGPSLGEIAATPATWWPFRRVKFRPAAVSVFVRDSGHDPSPEGRFATQSSLPPPGDGFARDSGQIRHFECRPDPVDGSLRHPKRRDPGAERRRADGADTPIRADTPSRADTPNPGRPAESGPGRPQTR